MLTKKRLVLFALLLALVAGFVVYPRLNAAPRVAANAPVARAPAEGAVAQSGQASDKQAAPGGGKTGGGGQATGGSKGGGAGIAVVTAVAAKADVPVTEDAVGWVEPIATVTVRPRMDGLIVE